MFPVKKILFLLLFFVLGYSVMLIISNLDSVKKAINSTGQSMLKSYANNAFPDYEFRVKEEAALSGFMKNGIKMMHFSKQELEAAKAKARAEGKSSISMSPPNVIRLDIYNVLLIPLFFLWTMVLISPIHWKRKLLVFLIATVLYILYFLLNVHLIIKSSMPEPGSAATFATFITVGLSIFVALIIWASLTLRRNVVKQFSASA